MTPHAKLHVNLYKGGFSADRWNIRKKFYSYPYTFFRNSPTGQTLRRIFACDGSNDVVSRNDVFFGNYKIWIAIAFSPTDPRCHGNEIWDKIGCNSVCVKEICEIFASKGKFSGWASECWKFHGNQKGFEVKLNDVSLDWPSLKTIT